MEVSAAHESPESPKSYRRILDDGRDARSASSAQVRRPWRGLWAKGGQWLFWGVLVSRLRLWLRRWPSGAAVAALTFLLAWTGWQDGTPVALAWFLALVLAVTPGGGRWGGLLPPATGASPVQAGKPDRWRVARPARPVHAELTAAVLGSSAGLIARGDWGALLPLLAAVVFVWALMGRSQRRCARTAAWTLVGGGSLIYLTTRLLLLRPTSVVQIEVGLVLLEAALASALAFAFTPVLALLHCARVHRYPDRLETAQVASAGLLAVMLMAGLARLWQALSVPLVDLPAVVLVLVTFSLAASSGVGGAVASAVALAFPLAAVRANAALVIYAAALGLLAGVIPLGGKMGPLIGGCLGIGMMAAWAAGTGGAVTGDAPRAGVLLWPALSVHQLTPFLLGSLLFALIPRGWLVWLQRLLHTATEPDWNRLTVVHLRQQIAARLGGVSGVLGQVAAAFDRLPVAAVAHCGSPRYPNTELSPTAAFLADIRSQSCRDCPLEKRCWQQMFPSTYWALMDLLAREPHATAPSPSLTEELPGSLRARCLRPSTLLASAVRAREMARVEATWQQRVTESRQLVAGELRGLAQLMEVLAREMMLDLRLDAGLSTRLEAEWSAHHYPPAHITVLEGGDGQREVHAEMDVPAGDEPAGWGERLAEVVGEVLQTAQIARWQPPVGDRESAASSEEARRHLRFRVEPAPVWQLDVGVCSRAKPGAAISGDSVLRFTLGPERECLILSDGMGAGWPAADESQAAVGMLRRLLEAGFRTDFAVRTVNAALLLRSSDQEKFATLDLLTVDRQAGQAELIKIGSPPSLLWRQGGPEVISTSSLPAGILATIPVDPQFIELHPGETLVLMTDGVAENIDLQAEPWATLSLSPNAGVTLATTEQAAREILRLALAAQGQTDDLPTDDATVVVIRLVPTQAQVADDPAASPSTHLSEYLRLAGSLLPMLDENPTRV